MQLIFRNPSYLWFLLTIVLLILLHFFTLKHTKRKALQFANFEAIERVTGSEILSKNIILLYIRMLMLICIIFSVAGTTIWYSGRVTNSDFVIAIDASNSMSAKDVEPSRLEAAKDAAIYFITSVRANTRIGVLSFSGSSFVEQDVTEDMNRVRAAIDAVTTRIIGGTDILDAVVTGTDMLFRSNRGAARVIILITDGQLNLGSVDDIVQYATRNGVTIHTIGVGTLEGSSLQAGNITNVISKLDEDTLNAIAYNTGGTYTHASNTQELIQAYTSILTSSVASIAFNTSPILLVIAVVLLLIEWALINTRYRTLP